MSEWDVIHENFHTKHSVLTATLRRAHAYIVRDVHMQINRTETRERVSERDIVMMDEYF